MDSDLQKLNSSSGKGPEDLPDLEEAMELFLKSQAAGRDLQGAVNTMGLEFQKALFAAFREINEESLLGFIPKKKTPSDSNAEAQR